MSNMQIKAVFRYSAPCPLHLIKLINEVLMSYYRHYAYFCLLHLSILNHSTRSTAGSQITVTTQHAEEVKIGEVILKNPHKKKKNLASLT